MTEVAADAAAIEVLAADLGHALLREGLLCATAESCTGGLVAAAITAIAGSSGWFDRGFVTYSNEAKMELLGVDSRILADHGAVSEPTAQAMAEGALARSRAQVSVSITGVAGPGGGTATKPVGMVCLAWAHAGTATRVVTCHFEGDRQAVRRASVVEALHGLRALLR
jgi:nicotinamide-nucleotide amidase